MWNETCQHRQPDYFSHFLIIHENSFWLHMNYYYWLKIRYFNNNDTTLGTFTQNHELMTLHSKLT